MCVQNSLYNREACKFLVKGYGRAPSDLCISKMNEAGRFTNCPPWNEEEEVKLRKAYDALAARTYTVPSAGAGVCQMSEAITMQYGHTRDSCLVLLTDAPPLGACRTFIVMANNAQKVGGIEWLE